MHEEGGSTIDGWDMLGGIVINGTLIIFAGTMVGVGLYTTAKYIHHSLIN